MIKKVVAKYSLRDAALSRHDFAYWLSRPPEERVQLLTICEGNSMEVQPDFRELLALLNAHEVEYHFIRSRASLLHMSSGNQGIGRSAEEFRCFS
jgi:hypothetical protein